MANEETKVVEKSTNETPLSESEKEQVQEEERPDGASQ